MCRLWALVHGRGAINCCGATAESADATLKSAFDEAFATSDASFFDTGDSYGTGELEGRAERLLGEFRGDSSHCVIGTKLAVYPWRLTANRLRTRAACR